MNPTPERIDRKGMKRDLWAGVALLAAALLYPLLNPGNYVLSQVALLFIWAAVVTQWNLVFGFAGILSLGHMAIFAVGGYATAMVGLYWQWSLWAALPVGALASVIASILMGAATLRLRGPYVAIMTLAISQVLYSLILTDVACFTRRQQVCINFSGGATGLSRYGDFGFNQWLGFKYRVLGDYYLCLGLLLVGSVFAFLIVYSALGATFRALRDNRICAEARGVDGVKYQLLVFAMSGVFTGLAGGVFAGINHSLGPDVLSPSLLLFVLSMMIVGGRGTKWGPILGAAALMLADIVLRDFPTIRVGGLSLIIILVMIFLPRGLAGLVDDIFNWLPGETSRSMPAGFDFRELQKFRTPKKTPFRSVSTRMS
jgi:branched-chain amino acid transport system permease protein